MRAVGFFSRMLIPASSAYNGHAFFSIDTSRMNRNTTHAASECLLFHKNGFSLVFILL